MSVRAVRGAIQVHENSVESIREAAIRLVEELLKRNGLEEGQLISVVFSVTDDLTRHNPATVIREAGYAKVPLFCLQEARIEGGMERVIRVLVTADLPAGSSLNPVYLNGAERLRQDLFP